MPFSCSECGAQFGFIDPGKSIDAGVNQEAFESRHAGGRQRLHAIGVPAHHTAPRGPIHPRLAARRSTLSFERGHINGLRHAIQGHVDQRGHAACRRRARGGFKAFPLGAAGLIDVHMRVDESRQQDGIAKIV